MKEEEKAACAFLCGEMERGYTMMIINTLLVVVCLLVAVRQ